MGTLDTLIVFAYLALMVGIGFHARRKQKNVEDYFVAGRRAGPMAIACLWIAAWIGGAAVVGTSSRAYEVGVSAGWYVVAQGLGCLFFALFMATRVKRLGDRHGHLTYPDFIEQSYDSRTRLVATLTTVIAYTAYCAGQLAAAAAILQAMLGWDYGMALAVSGFIVILYTAVGGYLALTYTDYVQVALLLGGVVLVGIPVAIAEAGPWSALEAALPASFFDPGGQGWDKIAALVVSMVLAFFVGMDSFSRCFAARDAAAARNGTLLAVPMILPLAVASVWLGLACAVLYPGGEVAGNAMLTHFVLDAFPPGLKGLMVVAILAAITSTADICILTASANYARDVHQRYLQPSVSPRALLRIGMMASVGAGLLGMLMAWQMRDIIDILQLGFTINAAGLFLPTVAAVYGWRIPPAAAFWSIALALATVVGWRLAAGLGGPFAIDPLWPGLAVSAISLALLGLRGTRRDPQPA